MLDVLKTKEAAYCFTENHSVDYAPPNHIQKNSHYTLCGIRLSCSWREMTGTLEELEGSLCKRCLRILKRNRII
jgi:hypothetical protein